MTKSKITILTLTILVFSLVVSGCVKKTQNQNVNVTLNENVEEIDESVLKIINRIPEGTTSGSVDKTKIVSGELESISVFFNNPIDPTSISSDSFYALWGIEDKVPGEIIYSDEFKKISLIFDNKIRGGNSGQEEGITVVIDNIKDVYGNTITKFIYNIHVGK